jgi:hypothetical protein
MALLRRPYACNRFQIEKVEPTSILLHGVGGGAIGKIAFENFGTP